MALAEMQSVDLPKSGESNTVDILTSRGYYDEAMMAIPQIQSRFLLRTLAYTSDDEIVGPMMDAMARLAASSDARVALHADSFSRIQESMRPEWLLRLQQNLRPRWLMHNILNLDLAGSMHGARLQEDQEKIDALVAVGGGFRWIREPGLAKSIAYVLDTDHVKATIADDTTYFRHDNLVRPSVVNDLSFVAKINSGQVADDMEAALFDEKDARRDIRLEYEGIGTIYIGDGKGGCSIAYDALADLAGDAKDRLQIAGLFMPVGRLARAASAAQSSGAEVDIIYGGCKTWKRFQSDRFNRLRARLHQDLPARPYPGGRSHANLMRADDTVAITTHDFVGNYLGTRELTFITNHPQALERINEIFEQFYPKEDAVEPIALEEIAA